MPWPRLLPSESARQREDMLAVLVKHEWRGKDAARALGISRVSLYKRMQRHGISARRGRLASQLGSGAAEQLRAGTTDASSAQATVWVVRRGNGGVYHSYGVTQAEYAQQDAAALATLAVFRERDAAARCASAIGEHRQRRALLRQ